MKETIHKYAVALTGLWEKSFGYKHVRSRKSVVERLERLALNYYNNVYNIANRNSVKNKGEARKPTSIRQLNKQWKSTSLEFRLAGKIFDFFIVIYCDIDYKNSLLFFDHYIILCPKYIWSQHSS